MKTILTIAALVLSGLSSLAQAQLSSSDEALALAKASGRMVFLLGGSKG